MKRTSRGFTLAELMVIVALVVIVGAAALFGFARLFGGAGGIDHDRAVRGAQEWARTMGVQPKAVNCVDYDTDGDGYVSCSISHENKSGDIKIIAVECAGSLSWNEGCRTPKPSLGGWE